MTFAYQFSSSYDPGGYEGFFLEQNMTEVELELVIYTHSNWPGSLRFGCQDKETHLNN